MNRPEISPAQGSRLKDRGHRLPHHVVMGLLCCAVGGCASWPRRWGDTPCCIATKPTISRQPIAWHLFDVTVLEPFEQLFHLGRWTRRLVGLPVRSLNLHHGRVAASVFLTARDPAQLSPEQVRWGPTVSEDRVQPPVVITKPKTEGKTPGFFVTDAANTRFLFKLDPIEAPELLSGAEVVTSKLFYALGYRVPSYEVITLRPEDFQIAPGTMVKEAAGQPQPFTEEALRDLLEGRLRDGTVRVSASKIVEGEVLGPARFKRFRDCADVRALRLAYAWVNNIDAKDHNSLLVWDGTKTLGYLIDFGTSLGADAGLAGSKQVCAGWLNIVDLKEAWLELVTLGMHQPPCPVDERPFSPPVGLFTAQLEPDAWKPYAPNVAFAAMNADDAQWMAQRMARLSREQIAAAVAAGQYSRPEDATYLVEVLEQRREAIVKEYLDDPFVSTASSAH